MFKAYIDESGIHAGADMFVLAGYLAHKVMEPEWVLDQRETNAFITQALESRDKHV
jgi:hypothetical protein